MFTIRSAQVADAIFMRDLQQRAFAEEARRCGTREIPPLLEDLPAIVRDVEHQIALVAARDGTVIGCVRAVRGEEAFTVRALVVHPTCQGQGIGSTLMKALEAAIPAPARIELTTNTAMEGNVPFYERHGYRVTEVSTPIPGITLAHMSKYIDIAGIV